MTNPAVPDPTVIRASQLVQPGQENRTVKYEGADFDAGASFFWVDSDPGERIGLHWHPYSETWVVIAGTVRFRLGDGLGDAADTVIQEREAHAGEIVTVPATRHHGFENAGEEVLRMVCIHAAPRMVQHDLE